MGKPNDKVENPSGNSFFDSFCQGLVTLGGYIGVTVTFVRAVATQVARTLLSYYPHTTKSNTDSSLGIESGNIEELERALAELVDGQTVQLSLQSAIRSVDIRNVEMDYEHWSSIADTVQNHHIGIEYLKLLGTILEAARDSCKNLLEKDQQLCLDVHCIIEYNKFKIELYRVLLNLRNAAHSSASDPRKGKLQQILDRLIRVIYRVLLNLRNAAHSSASDPRKGKLQQILDRLIRVIYRVLLNLRNAAHCQQILDILITVIDIYEQFCNKNIRITKHLKYDEVVLQPLLNDNTTIYYRYLVYARYENYYRKLDFCIAGVILEHFHSLKRRLELPLNAYQELESALYYYIYRVNEYWRLYLPENRNKNKLQCLIGNPPKLIEIPNDPHRLLNGPVIYLEWEKFKLSVKQFQQELKNPNVMNGLRSEKSKLPSDEVNTLTLLPILRDEHSLRKVVEYLEAGEHAIQRCRSDPAAVPLVVQRIVQVIGECFKSTDTVHLSSTTRALLHVFIPVSTLDHLKALRNDFSHLIKKKNRKPNLIRRIDLEETKPDVFSKAAKNFKGIKLAVNKVINFYQHILDKYLLREGINLIANREEKIPTNLKECKGDLSMHIEDYIKRAKIEKKLYDEKLSKSKISEQLIREYAELIANDLDLKRKLKEKEADCMKYIITNIQSFIGYINNTLDDIEKDTNIEKEKSSNLKIEEKNSVALKWNTIIYLLQFLIEQVTIFKNKSEIESKYSKLQLKKIPVNDDTGCLIKEMTDNGKIGRKLLNLLNREANTYSSNNNITLSTSQTNAPDNYDGIKKLKELISKKLYITNEEKEYLESQIGKYRGKEPLLDKVFNSEEISHKERNILMKTIDMDDRCKEILDYVQGSKCRRADAPHCLAQRATLLKNLIANNDVPSLVKKYHRDECFRMRTESILFDIYVIQADCGLPNNLFDDNERRLLAEFPLRNFLAHGHPLLEVIGQVLDPSDLPAAFFRSALLVAEDAPALVEVAKLYKKGIPAEEALANWNGPQTPRLKDYFTEKFYPLRSSKTPTQQMPLNWYWFYSFSWISGYLSLPMSKKPGKKNVEGPSTI